MTRRDMIVVAVLANIGVLAILFMLAFHSDEDKTKENTQIAYTLTEEPITSLKPAEETSQKVEKSDVIDAALDEEAPVATPLAGAEDENFQLLEPDVGRVKADDSAQPVAPIEKESTEARYVEVTIKRGDALEKIARANGTSVEAIMKANDMKNDRLRIGQVLKVPVGTKKVGNAAAKAAKPVAENETQKSTSQDDVEYYTLKSGDNPWKIAKQFHMKLDDLLKLNNLDEEKARNLKVGDTVRVK